MINYTFTDIPNWIIADNKIVYTWVWFPVGTESWVKPAIIQNNITGEISASIECEYEITGALLLSCNPNTTIPDWNEKNEVKGRIYNKTSDFTIKAGVTTYPADVWMAN